MSPLPQTTGSTDCPSTCRPMTERRFDATKARASPMPSSTVRATVDHLGEALRPAGSISTPAMREASDMSEAEVHDAKGAVISRSDGRDDGENWTENYEELPGGAGISLILESST